MKTIANLLGALAVLIAFPSLLAIGYLLLRGLYEIVVVSILTGLQEILMAIAVALVCAVIVTPVMLVANFFGTRQ